MRNPFREMFGSSAETAFEQQNKQRQILLDAAEEFSNNFGYAGHGDVLSIEQKMYRATLIDQIVKAGKELNMTSSEVVQFLFSTKTKKGNYINKQSVPKIQVDIETLLPNKR